MPVPRPDVSDEVAPRRRRPKDRRARILNVAAELFAERGYAAVSMQDIGAGADITGGAIYRHFASKDALLESLVLEIITMWESLAEETRKDAIAREMPTLPAHIRGAVNAVGEHRGKVATFLRERDRIEGEATAEIRRRVRALDRYWSDAISAVTPSLTPMDVTARHGAVLGVIATLSLPGPPTSNANLRALMIEGLEAATTAPPIETEHPARRRRRWAAPESRRQQILRTAVRLFNERGFHGVGLNEVGDDLGIAGPSIYEYFESKTDILLDAYDQAGGLVVSGVMEALEEATDAASALDGLVRSYVGISHRYVDLISVTRQEGGSLPDTERPRLMSRRRGVYETWIAILRDVRPELSPTEAHALVRSAFAIAITVARQFPRSPEMAPTNAAVVRAFLTPSAAR